MDKQEIREMIWNTMEEKNIARFPRPVHGRIPNFAGAEEAARKLTEMEAWKDANVIKSNPDSPQRFVRETALREGKTVYMAVPRLRELKCFIELDPRFLGRNVSKASTIKGAFRYGRKVHPKDMKKVDLIVAGSVAVDQEGGRVGKGGGYSDIEYAIGRQFGIVDGLTPLVTTVHPVQMVDFRLPMTEHDVPIDYVTTKSRTLRTSGTFEKPRGILWSILDEEKLEAIPILKESR